MLATSDFPIDEAMREFAHFGLQAAYLVPTPTGLTKSIMDAHESFRGYLRSQRIHDFASQSQGQEHKVVVKVGLVTAREIVPARMSLYRPNTKTGDPRVWITGLKSIASAGNLLAVFCGADGGVFVLNVSDSEVWSTRSVPTSPLGRALQQGSAVESATALLLKRMRGIASQGFVPSLRAGHTGVGFTLETMLGIKANASKAPDFMGIEIKAGRGGGQGLTKKSRTSLFSQVPNWRESPVKSGRELLDKAGYTDTSTGRLQLYCTSRPEPNPQGLYLALNSSEEWLESRLRHSLGAEELLVRWRMELLRERLATKHASTFWVSARVRKGRMGEEFHYVKVTHTQGPLVWNLGPALMTGAVTMDYTLSVKESGKTRDHGYLFKLREQDIDVLFPPSREFELT